MFVTGSGADVFKALEDRLGLAGLQASIIIESVPLRQYPLDQLGYPHPHNVVATRVTVDRFIAVERHYGEHFFGVEAGLAKEPGYLTYLRRVEFWDEGREGRGVFLELTALFREGLQEPAAIRMNAGTELELTVGVPAAADAAIINESGISATVRREGEWLVLRGRNVGSIADNPGADIMKIGLPKAPPPSGGGIVAWLEEQVGRFVVKEPPRLSMLGPKATLHSWDFGMFKPLGKGGITPGQLVGSVALLLLGAAVCRLTVSETVAPAA